jgi:hypothetical protein
MEIGEPVAKPPPPRRPLSPAGSTLAGVIRGPEGPLKRWPFILKWNGRAIDPGGLRGGRAASPFHDQCWWSDENGGFRFENIPEGCYVLDVLLPAGKLDRKDPHPGAFDDGARGPTPHPTDRTTRENPET